jgi:hypothetical protein
LILIGPGWKAALQSFLEQQGQYVAEVDRQYLTFVDTAEEAAAMLHQKIILEIGVMMMPVSERR